MTQTLTSVLGVQQAHTDKAPYFETVLNSFASFLEKNNMEGKKAILVVSDPWQMNVLFPKQCSQANISRPRWFLSWVSLLHAFEHFEGKVVANFNLDLPQMLSHYGLVWRADLDHVTNMCRLMAKLCFYHKLHPTVLDESWPSSYVFPFFPSKSQDINCLKEEILSKQHSLKSQVFDYFVVLEFTTIPTSPPDVTEIAGILWDVKCRKIISTFFKSVQPKGNEETNSESEEVSNTFPDRMDELKVWLDSFNCLDDAAKWVFACGETSALQTIVPTEYKKFQRTPPNGSFVKCLSITRNFISIVEQFSPTMSSNPTLEEMCEKVGLPCLTAGRSAIECASNYVRIINVLTSLGCVHDSVKFL